MTSSQPKSKMKTGTIVGIGAGVLLLTGGIWTGIYFYNKSKEKRESGSGSGGSGSGSNSGSQISPCISKPSSNECKKEKCSAMMVVSERGGSGATSAQIIECKKILGMSLSPCEANAGSRECIEWQKKQSQLVVSERGFDGSKAKVLVYA
jgi:hypothetical protein